MANINFIEKDFFERLFVMDAGYVLDFTNRAFQEFIHSVMGINVYTKYQGLSKAKILRKIIVDYDDITVGKLLLHLMEYMQARKMITDSNRDIFVKGVGIAQRLTGKTVASENLIQNQQEQNKAAKKSVDCGKYLEQLKNLCDFQDTPQLRGFAFEKYLRELFEAYNLQPRGSFKLIGEQIDGSFILHNEIYLLEAKWTNKQIDKSNLVVFNEKVSSKSGFTRGLYISFANFSEDALATLSQGRTVHIILMTVQELAIMLTRELDLSDVLWRKVRALAEEGTYHKSVLEI